jgi:hypothetical protein
MLVAVLAIAPVAGKPPNNGETILMRDIESEKILNLRARD